MFEWIRFILGTGLLCIGVATFILEVFGVFKFRYVLNRMHAAAMGDTLGISISLVGLMIFSGLNFTTLKMMLIVVFLWLASPVSSHLIARLEVSSGTKADGRYEKDMILTEEGKLTKAEKDGKEE